MHVLAIIVCAVPAAFPEGQGFRSMSRRLGASGEFSRDHLIEL